MSRLNDLSMLTKQSITGASATVGGVGGSMAIQHAPTIAPLAFYGVLLSDWMSMLGGVAAVYTIVTLIRKNVFIKKVDKALDNGVAAKDDPMLRGVIDSRINQVAERGRKAKGRRAR